MISHPLTTCVDRSMPLSGSKKGRNIDYLRGGIGIAGFQLADVNAFEQWTNP